MTGEFPWQNLTPITLDRIRSSSDLYGIIYNYVVGLENTYGADYVASTPVGLRKMQAIVKMDSQIENAGFERFLCDENDPRKIPVSVGEALESLDYYGAKVIAKTVVDAKQNWLSVTARFDYEIDQFWDEISSEMRMCNHEYYQNRELLVDCITSYVRANPEAFCHDVGTSSGD